MAVLDIYAQGAQAYSLCVDLSVVVQLVSNQLSTADRPFSVAANVGNI